MLEVQIPDVHEINVLYEQRTTDDTPIILVILWIFFNFVNTNFYGKRKIVFSMDNWFCGFYKILHKGIRQFALGWCSPVPMRSMRIVISRIIIESKVIKLNCKLKMCIKVLDNFLLVQFVFQWYYLPTVMTSTN